MIITPASPVAQVTIASYTVQALSINFINHIVTVILRPFDSNGNELASISVQGTAAQLLAASGSNIEAKVASFLNTVAGITGTVS